MIPDGSRVAYVGPEKDGLGIGDEGTVLVGEAGYSHVKWITGARAEGVDMVREGHLVVNGSLSSHPLTADSFEGSLVGLNVEAVMANRGPLGLINALSKQGHLAALPQIADEARALVAARVRNDPSISEVLGSLDPDDAEEFVGVAVAVVLGDTLEG